MKTLLLLLGLAVANGSARAQGSENEVKPVPGVFYELQTEAVGYSKLADTLITNSGKSEIPPIYLSKGSQVLVTGKLGARWRRFFYQGYDYFVASNSLRLSKDQAGRHSAGSDKLTVPRGDASGQPIQVGPRGGRYYINSNGNKTYIKH